MLICFKFQNFQPYGIADLTASTASQQFLSHARYDLYDFLSEKSLRLAIFYGIGGTFNLAIRLLFTGSLTLWELILKH